MPSYLKISVRFLLDEFDGRGDRGEPEWPPSPLRLFQALTNSAARLDMNAFAPALKQLEQLSPPHVISSKKADIQPHHYGYKTFVPNNLGDLVAKSWSRDSEDDIANYRAAKIIRPTRLPESAAVHYLWEIVDGVPNNFLTEIQQLAHAVSAFGWGVNMVVADANIEQTFTADSTIDLERWLPVESSGGNALRVPIAGTLEALHRRHTAFLNRLPTGTDGSQYFRPVPPLTTYRIITYRRDTEVTKPPFAIFALRHLPDDDDSKFAIFDPKRRRLHLTGMLRHLASQPDFVASLGWDKDHVDSFVLGHDKRDPAKTKPTENLPRITFIPLPSEEWRGEERGDTIGEIRRVLVTVSGHIAPAEFNRIVRALEGRELIEVGKPDPIAFLRRQSDGDNAIQKYFSESSVWATVTPLVLPGYDDPRKLRQRLRDSKNPLTAEEKNRIILKLEARIDHLIRKAFIDAGLPPTLVNDAKLEWRGSGYFPGIDLASNYSVPDQCRRFRRLHVRIEWRKRANDGSFLPIMFSGPLCVGSGRFSGLGLFFPLKS